MAKIDNQMKKKLEEKDKKLEEEKIKIEKELEEKYNNELKVIFKYKNKNIII